ncbi:MAG: YIP1 family protein [Candidatus Woesearchaeota archaeon]
MSVKDIFFKFKNVLLNQKNFFKRLKREKTIKKGFIYFVFLTALILLLVTNKYVSELNNFLYYLHLASGLELFNVAIEITPLWFIVFYILFLVTFTLFAFARYWLVHLTVKLFKPKATYKDTYNSLSYSITPGYVAMPFFAFGIFLLFFDDYRLFAYLLLAIYVLLEGYSFYIRSKGLAEIHEFSFWRGFACLYIYSNILLVAVLLVLLLFIGFLISSLTYFISLVS